MLQKVWLKEYSQVHAEYFYFSPVAFPFLRIAGRLEYCYLYILWLAPTAAVAKARRENKAWNQNNNKGGDARVERSSTAAVTGMMSPQDWWTTGTKGEHHREDLDISGHQSGEDRSPDGRRMKHLNQPINQPRNWPGRASVRTTNTIRRLPPLTYAS